ncbi:hypothetical protein RI129_000858 [Pyrocoelia pectoralis]|uniref:Protein MIX23 n=1 Tax=Pyrocoelia pectoralis TaxID=417401 RepID=A0AAN7VU87_9COLE
MECTDFSEFQETLKNMRRVDDIIINTLNSVIPTDSFNPDAAKACKDLHNQLVEGNRNRKNAITKCINVSAERLKQLREQRDTDQSLKPKNLLRAEQTKLRMLQVELSVEDLVEERSSKVFQERCRRYYKPS